jgi:hypothetical protein
MNWPEAKSRISNKIKTGTDLNTARSTFRVVLEVDSPISNSRYGYREERGFVVRIGRNHNIIIPWSMLEICFAQLSRREGYSGKFFRKHYPRQASDHPCHVHVVGRIFVVSGFASETRRTYRFFAQHADGE